MLKFFKRQLDAFVEARTRSALCTAHRNGWIPRDFDRKKFHLR